jgi:TIR domain-containing protein
MLSTTLWLVFDARLVVTPRGRSALADLGLSTLVEEARLAGWTLLAGASDIQAEVVVSGHALGSLEDRDPPFSEHQRADSTIPSFWIYPHRDPSKRASGRFDWYADSHADYPEEHGWLDVTYSASEVISSMGSWLGRVIAHRALRLFLSYASEDLEQAQEVADTLSRSRHDVWLDIQQLLPGQDWDLEVRQAIGRAEAIVVLVSPRSVSKVGYIQKEIRLALDAADERPEGAVFIVPIRIDGATMPDRLSRLHYVDLHSDDWSERLQRALRRAREQRRDPAIRRDDER